MFQFILSIVFINFKIEMFFVFLAPFNKKTFITYYFSFQFFNINIRFDDSFLNEFFAIFISSVQINGTNQCFKNISVNISTELLCWNRYFYKFNKLKSRPSSFKCSRLTTFERILVKYPSSPLGTFLNR